jgi:hypothetical protein
MPMQYTEADLAHLIKGLESEFTKEFGKAGVLSKSEDGAPEKKDKKPSDGAPEKKDGPPADAKPKEEAAPAAPPEGQEAAPAADAPPAAAAPGAAAPAGADAGHGYDDEDMQHMKSMYASMSRAELIAHHDAVKEALDAQSGAQAAPAAGAPAPAAPGMDQMGKSEKGKSELCDENPVLNSKAKAGGKEMNGDKKNGGIEGQAPSGSPGAKSPASDASKSVQMSKTERQDRNGGKIEAGAGPKGSPGAKSPASTDQGNLSDMEKSEKAEFDLIKSELDAEKAKNADMKKNMDAVQNFLTKFVEKVSAPKGKAITEIGTLQKNEDGSASNSDMSKSEITAKLLVKSQDPKTTPQDRAAINAFYLNGANVSTISHLLK